MNRHIAYYISEDEKQFEEFQSSIKEILNRIGIRSKVIFKRRKLEELKNDMILERPSFVFIDIFRQRNNNRRAFRANRMITSLSLNFPDIIFCFMSRDSVDWAGIGEPHPISAISIAKSNLKSTDVDDADQKRDYERYIAFKIKEQFKRCIVKKVRIKDNRCDDIVISRKFRNGIFCIDIDREISPGEENAVFDVVKLMKFDPSKQKREAAASLLSVIEGCCVDASRGENNYILDGIELKVLSEGYSGALVGQISIIDDAGEVRFDVPGVVKIARKEESLLEYENHQKNVKWVLPYSSRVDILGKATTKRLGAVCYSFVMGGYAKPVSLRDAFRDGNSKAASSAISEIFNPEKKNWYSTRKEDSSQRLSTYLFSHPFFSGAEAIINYEQRLIRIFENHGIGVTEGSEGVDIRLGAKTIRVHSLSRLATENFGALEQCMSHGDLNANNIMYDPDSDKIAFIDFQQTGYWYNYRDFVSFESSVRLDFVSKKPVTTQGRPAKILELYRWEQSLNAQNFLPFSERARKTRKIPEYLKIVADVRALAYGNHEGKFKAYLLALLTHHWWLLVRFYDEIWDDRQRRRQIGCVIAGWECLLSRE